MLALLGNPRPRPGLVTGVLSLASITDHLLDAADEGRTRVEGVGGTLLGEPGTLASEGVESLDPDTRREAALGVR